jgi:hypothetical protein
MQSMHEHSSSSAQSAQAGPTGFGNGFAGHDDSYNRRAPGAGTGGMRDVLAAVGGMLIPLITQIWHAH